MARTKGKKKKESIEETSIEDRVKGSFGKADGKNISEADKENISKYLDWIISTLGDYAQNNRRTATLLLFIVAAFELVVYSRNSNISIGSFVIARGSIVFDFAPALVAYFCLQIIADWNKTDQLMKVFRTVFALWSEKAEENDLGNFLLGSAPLYWNPTGGFTGRLEPTNKYRSDRLEIFSTSVIMITVLVGVLAFEAHAYYVLFAASGSKLVLWAVSLFITVIYLATATLTLFASNNAKPSKADRDRR